MNMKKFQMLLLFVTMLTTACAQDFERDTFKAPNGKTVDIYAIKHGSMRIVYDGKEIEVDPVAKYAPETDYTLLPKADLILVTHEHFDHLDLQTVATLTKKSTLLIANPNSAKQLRNAKVMKNGDHFKMSNGIMIDAVPAYNITPGHEQFHPKGRDNGYILTLGGLRVYIAGDTEDIEELSLLKNIDVAFLPVNQPYTMTPEQAARAAKMFNPKVLFPYHFGKTDVEQVKTLLSDTNIDVRIRKYQ